MSAFAGIIRLDGDAIPGDRGGRMAAALIGRGFSAPATILHTATAAFAFRRRLVVAEDADDGIRRDAETGAVSLFDGRLDNRDSLIDLCGLPATRPVSDGELASRAYRRWGADAPAHLLGDFAWVVWDGTEQRVLLARDHSIHRALFFFRTDTMLAFATSYHALFALPEVPRVLDEDRIVDVIASTPDLTDRSLYRDVHWVRPAEQVVLTRSGMRQSRFWQPAANTDRHGRSDGNVVEEARALFDTAVACRSRMAGPRVVMTSGGLDSSAVAATMAMQQAPGIVHTLTMVPADAVPDDANARLYHDERPLVAQIAARYPNLQAYYLSADAADVIEADPVALFMMSDTPLRGPANTGWYHGLFRRAEALGASVVLTGGFGNITYAAQGFSHLSGLLADGLGLGFIGPFLALRRHVSREVWSGWGRAAFGSRFTGLRQIKHALNGRDWKEDWRRRTALNPDFQRDALFRDHYVENAVVLLDGKHPQGRIRELNYLLQRSRMQVESRAAIRAYTGIDQRDPFADRRIIEFCLSLPDAQFLHNGQPRGLARRVFADRLPAAIVSNRRQGEQNSDWYLRLPAQRADLQATLERLERSSLARRILDLPRLRRMLEAMPTNPVDLRRTGNAYKVMFSRAIHVGRFLAWYEGTN
jgi:asparagine synthase (glutamine-hydrolysing)